MNINITEDKYQEKEFKAIFNGGIAGTVRDCTAEITRKGADDKDNAPKYKIIFKAPDGAEINRGYFVPKDDASEASKDFLVKDCMHIMSQCKFKADKTNFTSVLELLDYTMVSCKNEITKNKFGVAVCFGNKYKPKAFLEVDGFWGFRNEENISDTKPLKLSNNAMLTRIDPTNVGMPTPGVDPAKGDATDDLPF